MSSKFLSSLSEKQYNSLTNKLFEIQNETCFICEQKINLQLNETNIDHIIPLATRGKDIEDNFALTHASCNKSKQDANLRIARILQKLNQIHEIALTETNKPASLRNVLQSFGGAKYELKYKIDADKFEYSFDKNGDNSIKESTIFTDKLSGELYTFIECPIEYIFHDELINPRGINNSISKLIKEFYKSNPQLHLSLARIDNGKLKIFDGQHKAVAQILLGIRKLVLRVFISPNVERLTEANSNAGSTLRQVAFDKSIMRQLHDTLYRESIKKYQSYHNLTEDNFNFSEQQLVDFFKGESSNVKKYILDAIKYSITNAPENNLRNYIDFEGKAKNLPISYSAFDKTFLTSFLSLKLLNTPIDYLLEKGENPREIELVQIVKTLNILADNVYVNKFITEVGTNQIEKKVIDKKDNDITDEHLIAYRMSKEEIMSSWLPYLIKVITNYFDNTGKIYNFENIFQTVFDDQLWKNISNFIINLSNLPLWKDRSMSATHFSGKQTRDYWATIFSTGNSQSGSPVLLRPINFQEMIRPIKTNENNR